MMNKDEIQPLQDELKRFTSCGLVMNKDEIQHINRPTRAKYVVVW